MKKERFRLPFAALLAINILSFRMSHATESAYAIQVQVLGINDFHGHLEPPTGSIGKIEGIDAGGIEYLATHIKGLREGHPNSVTVSAGDLIGASPLLSAMFHDEPTIEAMNLLGLDFNAVGNHEFDDGWNELLRMQRGGCFSGETCHQDQAFEGARFEFLAANVIREDNGKPLFPAYKIRQFGAAKIAFVGLVVESANEIVTPTAVSGISFHDEADTVNALLPELEEQGVQTIIVLIHEGGYPTGGYNECPGISGAIVDIANRLNDRVGVVISGHTHQAYNCVINRKLVTSAASYGRLVTDIELLFDSVSGKMISAKAENLIMTRNVDKASEQSELIQKYKTIAAPVANKIIGKITQNLTRAQNQAGESSLGRVIADAQLEATSAPNLGGAEIAFLNPGGIRADLSYLSSEANEGNGNVTYGEMFTVQPFGNNLMTLTLTGAELVELLEQQFEGCGYNKTRMLQISRGFQYAFHRSGEPCHKVDPATLKLNGHRVRKEASYRVTANNFLAEGGDGFPAFKKGTNRLGGAVDSVALEKYFERHSPVAPTEEERIQMLP